MLGGNCYVEKSADIQSNLITNHHEWYEVQDLTSNELEHYHFGRKGINSNGGTQVFPLITKYKHVYNYAVITIGNTQAKARFLYGSPKVGDCIPISVQKHIDGTSTITMNFQKYRLNTDFNQCR
jgi:hypothetical protein